MLAGEPQRLGGALASGLGWAVLVSGLLMAVLVSVGGSWLFGNDAVAKFVGLPVAILSSLAGGGSLVLGRRLKRGSSRARHEARIVALRAYALGHGGAVTVAQAAQVLRGSEAQADALLTELAVAEQIHQELTEQGELLYRFDRPALEPVRARVIPQARVESAQASDEVEVLEAIVEPPASHQRAVR